jgi:hypothetical protein
MCKSLSTLLFAQPFRRIVSHVPKGQLLPLWMGGFTRRGAIVIVLFDYDAVLFSRFLIRLGVSDVLQSFFLKYCFFFGRGLDQPQ